MRALSLLALLSLTASAAAAQASVFPARCPAACPRDSGEVLRIDSMRVWANLARGGATTYVDHVVRNATDGTLEGAFFFALPPGATLTQVMVHDSGRVLAYDEWSAPAESRRMLVAALRGQPRSRARAYDGMEIVHVRIAAIPPHGTRRVKIAYTQTLRPDGGAVTYRYPLHLAPAMPAGALSLGAEVATPAGFVDFGSPSHAVDVRWGSEAARCPPRARCGWTGVASRRKRVVRLADGADARRRDFVLVYTPARAETDSVTVDPDG